MNPEVVFGVVGIAGLVTLAYQVVSAFVRIRNEVKPEIYTFSRSSKAEYRPGTEPTPPVHKDA